MKRKYDWIVIVLELNFVDLDIYKFPNATEEEILKELQNIIKILHLGSAAYFPSFTTSKTSAHGRRIVSKKDGYVINIIPYEEADSLLD